MGIVLISFTSHTLSGFGSIIIAVTLGSNFYPIKTLLPILVPLDVAVNSYIVTRYHATVDRPFLLKNILPYMAVGFVAGVALFSFLNSTVLKLMFGLFVVIISARELFLAMRRSETGPLSSRVRAGYLMLGGFIQGIFASGGPPVVYAVSRSIRDKAVFRSTLSALWLTINTILIITYVIAHRLTKETITYSGLLLPAVLLGILMGELLHRYINEEHFRIVIFCILIVAGFSILIPFLYTS